MTLPKAILNTLATMPKPVTAEILLAFLPGFIDVATLGKGEKQRIGKLTAQLETLEAVDEVTAIPDHHAGRLWKITPNGRAAV